MWRAPLQFPKCPHLPPLFTVTATLTCLPLSRAALASVYAYGHCNGNTKRVGKVVNKRRLGAQCWEMACLTFSSPSLSGGIARFLFKWFVPSNRSFHLAAASSPPISRSDLQGGQIRARFEALLSDFRWCSLGILPPAVVNSRSSTWFELLFDRN